MKSFDNELGRLSKGVGERIKGTDIIFLLAHEKILTDRRKDFTYVQIVCNCRPQKDKPNRTRLVAGGNLINFREDVSTRAADITT